MNPITLADISINLPSEWKENQYDWSNKAAIILKKHGVVALMSNDQDEGLIHPQICHNANKAAFTRVNEMHRRIDSRGLDSTGIDQPYRFAEIVCRDDGGRRFDVPVPWLGEGGSGEDIGTPLNANEHEAFKALHESMEEIGTSVMNSLWPHKNNSHEPTCDACHVAAAGFLMNKPGSQSQNWHRDGPEEGYIDCFVPLIDLNESIGPTAILPGTHLSTRTIEEIEATNENALIPILKWGDMLLFDYRTIHRGIGNISESTTRTLAYAVFRRNQNNISSDLGDIHNFPAALTLEYD